MRKIAAVAALALMCACTAPVPDGEPTSLDREVAPSTEAVSLGLTCDPQKRTQAFLGRSIGSMTKAATWGVPADGEVGDILSRNKNTRVFAIVDDSGDVVAEVGIERLDGGWARASRTTCA